MNAFKTGSKDLKDFGDWIDYYNQRRPHPSWAENPGRSILQGSKDERILCELIPKNGLSLTAKVEKQDRRAGQIVYVVGGEAGLLAVRGMIKLQPAHYGHLIVLMSKVNAELTRYNGLLQQRPASMAIASAGGVCSPKSNNNRY